MKLAACHYERDENGRIGVVVTRPAQDEATTPPSAPWVPRVGEDRRDLRDPEKVGKRRLRR